MEGKFVSFGDYLLLSSEEPSGFLSSAGFTDPDCYVQEASDEDLMLLANKRHMIFQILPKLSYENQRELDKYREEKSHSASHFKSEMHEEEKQILMNLELRAKAEEDLNEKTIHQRAGENLTYGQEVQLRHMSSGMLLSVSKEKAKGDKSCLLVSLSFDGGSGVCFKIASRFKFRQEGDKVMYGDNVLFLSMKEVGNYLHVTNKLIDIDTGHSRITKLDLRPPASTFARRFEANSSSLKTSWRLTPYSIVNILEKDKNLLKGGELIRLKHTETEGHLACEGYDFTKDGMAEVYVRQYKGEDDLEKYSAATLFIVEKDSSDIEGMPCVWTSSDRSSVYRIRHFVTGRPLCVVNAAQDNTVSLSKHPHEITVETLEDIRESTVFGMVSTSIEMDNFIRDGSIIQLKFMPDNSFLEPTSEEWKFLEETKSRDSLLHEFEELNGAIYEPLQEEDLAVARYKVALTKNASEVDSFFITKANEQEVQEIEFILSTIPVLTNFVSSFMKGNEPYKYLYEAVKEAIAQFIIFLSESEEMDPLKREGIPIRRRQKFVRELGVIDLVCNLLHWPFYSGIHDFSSTSSSSLMGYIVKLGYKFVKQAAKDYRLNETYCSQWIGLFLQHAQKASDPDDSNAEETLTEIISDNKWIVEKQIKPHMIEKFVSLCKDNVRHEKYMNLLSSLCMCNGQAVTRNQNIISDLLLKDVIFREVLLMRLRMSTNGEVEVEVKEYDRWVNLSRLQNESVTEDSGRIFSYFLSLMDLVAVLGYDRNYQSQELNEIYPFDITYRIVTDSKIRDDIRARFVRVMLNLHIDQGEVHKLNVPNFIRVWREIDLENPVTIQYSKAPLSPGFKHLKLFVLEYLTSINGVLKSAEAEKNLLIKEILTMTQFMINCGFYQSIEELSSVLNPMILILDGTTDLVGSEYIQMALRSPTRANTMSKMMMVIQRKSGREQERYNIREDSLIITECKKIICQIFMRVIDLRTDYMMTKYLQMYRRSCEMLEEDIPEPRSPKSLKNGNLIKQKSMNTILNSGLFDFKNTKLKNKYKVPAHLKDALKWINEILAEHSLDLQATSSKLLCILVDLCLYRDLSLVVEGFSIMLMQFSSRIRFLNSLNELQMLEQEQAVENLILVKKNLKELKHYSERAENWLGRFNNTMRPSTSQALAHPQEIKTKEAHEQVSEILIYLIEFTREIETNPDLQFESDDEEDYIIVHNFSNKLMNSKDISSSPEPQDYMNFIKDMFINGENPNMKEPYIYDTNEKSLTENQRLLRNLKVYEPVLELIRHKGISVTCYSKEKHFHILRLCYIFLCKFCRNNSENKHILYENIELFLDDVDKNIFATTLLREIFRNNYALTANVPVNLLRSMARSIDSVPVSDKKCEMLKTLTIFMYVNTKILKQNQTEVLNQLASSERKNIIMLFTQPHEQDKLKQIVRNIVSKYEVGAGQEILVDLPDELIYALSLIDVMTMSAWDKSGQAELICQSLIPLSLFETLFQITNKLWPLKKSLILFFLHVYLDIEFTMNEDEVVMWKCVEMIRNDLKWIYENCVTTDKLISTTHNILYRSSDGIVAMSEYANNYVYEGIFPCLQEIFLKRARTIPNESVAGLKEVALYCIYFYKLAYNETYKNLSTELIMNMVKVDILHKIVDDQGLPFTSEDVYKMKLKKSSAVKSKLTYKNSCEFGVVKDFKTIIRTILKEDIIKDAIEIEFEEMVRAMNDITKNSLEAFGEAFVVDFHHLIKSFIALMGPDSELTAEIKVMGLKILRKIIEIENKNMVVPASEWDTKEWIEFEKMIVHKQELLCDLGVVTLVWNIVIQSEEEDIIYECVLLCIAMLLGGNLKVQNTFLRQFRIDKGNEFLLKIKRLLLQNFEIVRKKETNIIEAAERKYKQTHSKFGNITAGSDSSSDESDEPDIDQDDPNFPSASDPKSFDLLVNLLRFIQLLCEGHHENFQNYLREQSQDGVVNIKNFNFINAISGMLGPYIKFLHANNLQLGYQILDTLTEVVQGPCRENQRVLSHAKIIDNGRDLLAGLRSDADRNIRGFDEDNLEMVGELKSKAVNFLLSLLEGDADQEILLRITESLDYKEIKRRMWEVYESFVTENLDVDPVTTSLSSINSKLTKDCFEGAVSEGFNLFILINKLADDYPPAQHYVKEKTFEENEYKAYSFFKMHTGRIEVIKDDVLTRLYFPIQPVCKHISEDSKEDLMLSVNRDSPANKVSDLLSRAPDLIDEMKHNEKLSRAKFKITSERISSLRDTSLLLVLIANYLILFNTDYSVEEYKGKVPDQIDAVLYGIVVVVLAFNGLVLIGWFFLRGQLIINKGWRKLVENSPNHKRMKDTIFDKHVSNMTPQETYRILMGKGPTAPEFYHDEKRNFVHLSTKLTYYSLSLGMIIIDTNFTYFVIYIALAALGFINYIFLSILLLDVVYRYRVLRNVLAAVVTNKKQLLMTAVLGFVIIYIYAFWGFLIDRDMYYDSTIGTAGENQCQSLWQCFLFTLNYGFRSGGGVGDVLQKVSFTGDINLYYGRFLYDLSFFVIVVIIILNVIFGIIIDTFAQLRDMKSFIEEDMKTKCFICNQERSLFDRYSYGFEKHQLEDHNVWQYIYFLIHLQVKDNTEFNGTESYCDEMIKKEDISWIPLHRAMCLDMVFKKKEEEEEVSKQVKGRVAKLEEDMRELIKVVKLVSSS
jgi:hypothetical protein